MAGYKPIPVPLVVAEVGEDWHALCRVDALVCDLRFRLDAIRKGSSAIALRADANAALAKWNQLDELGVDLNVPNLKTFLTALAAEQASDGSTSDEPISAEAPLPRGLPLPSEETAGEADGPQATSAGGAARVDNAAETSASPAAAPWFDDEQEAS